MKKRLFETAKPLFVGSIPTAAFLESITDGQPSGCPSVFVSVV
jgi:hypothetical protein